VAVLTKTVIFYLLGLYSRYWCLASVNDLALLAVVVILSTLVLTILFVGLHPVLDPYCLAMYRTVPVIDGLLTGLIVSGYRFALRGLYHWRRCQARVISGRRTLVVGAGQSGALVVQEMRANPQLKMEPVAFVDDDPVKIGAQIQGLPVLGGCKDIATLAELYQIQRIIVAIPSVPFLRQQEILEDCKRTGITTYKLPGIYELLAGHKTISDLPKIDINRLLHRSPVQIDQMEVADAMAGTTLLVTGAGGSIGRELCRQLARFKPKKIILLGHGENSIFEIDLDLRLSFPGLVTSPVIVDVRNQRRINQVVAKYQPSVIFHAAAHKHVPFMQDNVEEAITNNIVGTRNMLQAAEQYGVKRFVLISTDKAVNPSSIMGATKRLAEFLVLAAAQRSGRAYMAVRFGNVLGSRGSVIPIFQQQIAAGGPLTVTHPEMCRYFMTIPEAVQLVLQASVLGKGGEVFVLDMGQPICILDLATDLIKMSGLEPERDIKIVFSGPRPGEKLFEELFLKDEGNQRTKHQRIFVTMPGNLTQVATIEQVVKVLIELTDRLQGRANAERLKTVLLEICYYIDEFQSKPESALLKQPIKPGLAPPSASLNIQPASSSA
jgi:FlaA1/EpsC-like NDP-sugar epimerase